MSQHDGKRMVVEVGGPASAWVLVGHYADMSGIEVLYGPFDCEADANLAAERLRDVQTALVFTRKPLRAVRFGP